eukprot:gene12775-17127_t
MGADWVDDNKSILYNHIASMTSPVDLHIGTKNNSFGIANNVGQKYSNKRNSTITRQVGKSSNGNDLRLFRPQQKRESLLSIQKEKQKVVAGSTLSSVSSNPNRCHLQTLNLNNAAQSNLQSFNNIIKSNSTHNKLKDLRSVENNTESSKEVTKSRNNNYHPLDMETKPKSKAVKKKSIQSNEKQNDMDNFDSIVFESGNRRETRNTSAQKAKRNSHSSKDKPIEIIDSDSDDNVISSTNGTKLLSLCLDQPTIQNNISKEIQEILVEKLTISFTRVYFGLVDLTFDHIMEQDGINEATEVNVDEKNSSDYSRCIKINPSKECIEVFNKFIPIDETIENPSDQDTHAILRNVVDKIDFSCIEQVMFGGISSSFRNEYFKQFNSFEQPKSFIAFQVKSGSKFNSVQCGVGKVLDPSAKWSEAPPNEFSKPYASKVILFLSNSNKSELKQFRKTMKSLKIENNIAATVEEIRTLNVLKNYLYRATHSSDINNDEILKRAKQEIEKMNRKKERKNAFVLQSEDPTDSLTYFVYPPQYQTVDAVHIYNADMKRLEPGVYLNDSLIDLRIKLLVQDLSPEKKNLLHAFSCMFYTKLTESTGTNKLTKFKEMHNHVCRWTKSFELFCKEFILIPINKSLHWSLSTIIRPAGALSRLQNMLMSPQQFIRKGNKSPQKKNNNKKRKLSIVDNPSQSSHDEILTADNQNDNQHENKACILFMDSLNLHQFGQICGNLKMYLFHEWENKKWPAILAEYNNNKQNYAHQASKTLQNDDIETIENDQNGNVPSTPFEEEVELNVEEYLEYVRQTFENIKTIKCQVPRQTNGTDCGVFVIKYAELILQTWPSSTIQDLDDSFKQYFHPESFHKNDVEKERIKMKDMFKNKPRALSANYKSASVHNNNNSNNNNNRGIVQSPQSNRNTNNISLAKVFKK